MTKITVNVTAKNDFGKIAGTLMRELAGVVRETAFDIEKDMKSRAPVDTGFLRASIYTVTAKGYAQHKRMTVRAKKRADRDIFPDVPNVESELEAAIAVGAMYGMYLEYGTARMPAQPFFIPALQSGARTFQRRVQDAVDRLT